MQIKVDYLIIGGGIAGTTAAETIRAHDSRGSVAILSGEPYPLYSRVLLPRYVQDHIARERVFLRTLADYEKHNIKLYMGESAEKVDPGTQIVETSRGNTFAYAKLLITTGGEARPWTVGDMVPDVLRLQTIDDADRVRARIQDVGQKRAIVVGGSFIGMEFVNSFVAHGFSIDLITRDGGCWFGRIGKGGSAFLERRFERHNITLHRASEVRAIQEDGRVTRVALSRDEILEADVVAVGVGIDRAWGIFREAGFLGNRGIKTNAHLETAAPHVWAAGDVAEYEDTIVGGYRVAGNWNSAFLQGRVAGLNMAGAGERTVFREVETYSITVLGDHVTFLGDAVIDNTRQVITRSDQHGQFYELFFVRDNRLIGSVMINKFADRKNAEFLIKNRIDIHDVVPHLSDPDFDFAGLSFA